MSNYRQDPLRTYLGTTLDACLFSPAAQGEMIEAAKRAATSSCLLRKKIRWGAFDTGFP